MCCQNIRISYGELLNNREHTNTSNTLKAVKDQLRQLTAIITLCLEAPGTYRYEDFTGHIDLTTTVLLGSQQSLRFTLLG